MVPPIFWKQPEQPARTATSSKKNGKEVEPMLPRFLEEQAGSVQTGHRQHRVEPLRDERWTQRSESPELELEIMASPFGTLEPATRDTWSSPGSPQSTQTIKVLCVWSGWTSGEVGRQRRQESCQRREEELRCREEAEDKRGGSVDGHRVPVPPER
ncbi:GL14080 [Drosophila persimilis]|uniref:GL14080 n=1 Tax=Drosophila persimilis TaxID=7234 RepID=B4HBR6_DROPE|nr:GL14080 [Drosophila persimilis]